MNTITAVGRLGKDATLRDVGQQKVCTFSIAVEKTKKDDKGNYLTDWFKVDIWGKRAESLHQYLKKGTLVCVSGRGEMDSYQKQDNTTASVFAINANEIKLLSRPAGQQQSQAPAAPPPAPPKPATTPAAQDDLSSIFASEDEIPF